MNIKICGITTPEMGSQCFEAGADMIGLVHYEPSPRHLPLSSLQDICHAIRPFRQNGRHAVLVVADLTVEGILRLLEKIDHAVDYVQLHGRYHCTEINRLAAALENSVALIQVIRDRETCSRLLRESDSEKTHPIFLLEMAHGAMPGGNGTAWNWSDARTFCNRFPTFLAGGITSNNVSDAIARANPCGIDVSSGVETSPGIKDRNKIVSFIETVRKENRS